MNTNTYALVGSVVIHLAVFAAFSPTPAQKSQPEKQEYTVSVTLVPLDKGTITEVEKQIASGIGSSPTGRCNGDDQRFLGVGLLFDWKQTVTDAPVYYPGYRAGIRIGDQITNDEIGLTHDGFVELDILRNGQEIKFKIKAEDICFERNSKPTA